MRLLLCLNDDFLANYALNLLVPHLEGHSYSIALSKGIGLSSLKKAAIFADWARVEHDLIYERLFPVCERRGMVSGTYGTFAQLAQQGGGTVEDFSSINGPQALAYIREVNPDLIIAVRFGHIFKAPLFTLPRYGILNLHAGMLPHYRGAYATFWAMLHQEREIGCALHYVTDGGIDTGDVVEQQRITADYSRSVMANIAALYTGAAQMIARAVAAIERSGKVPAAAQPRVGGGYYHYPQDEDIAQLVRQGGSLYAPQDYAFLSQLYQPGHPCLQTA